MGQRTVFYQSQTVESLKDHLTNNYIKFRPWILIENRNSIDEFDERLITQNLEDFLNNNSSLGVIENISQKIIDELTLQYLQVYCDYGEGKNKFEIVGPMMSTWRYDSFKKQVSKSNDIGLIKICSVLDNGRSLIEGNPFSVDDVINVIGFWSANDQQQLYNKLILMKEKLKDNEGFEFLISVLEETKGRNLELIIDIEK